MSGTTTVSAWRALSWSAARLSPAENPSRQRCSTAKNAASSISPRAMEIMSSGKLKPVSRDITRSARHRRRQQAQRDDADLIVVRASPAQGNGETIGRGGAGGGLELDESARLRSRQQAPRRIEEIGEVGGGEL